MEDSEKSNVAVLNNLIAVFCYPLVSKFMICLGNKVIKKSLNDIEIKVPGIESKTTGRSVRPPASGLKRKP